jgi:hypothetical protein
MLILVDSGSSHSFVSSAFVQSAGLPTTAMGTKAVFSSPKILKILQDSPSHQIFGRMSIKCR